MCRSDRDDSPKESTDDGEFALALDAAARGMVGHANANAVVTGPE
jgi:hypothetical protein